LNVSEGKEERRKEEEESSRSETGGEANTSSLGHVRREKRERRRRKLPPLWLPWVQRGEEKRKKRVSVAYLHLEAGEKMGGGKRRRERGGLSRPLKLVQKKKKKGRFPFR